ncbi:hypothetical protein O6H91_12G017500 [Diphasiastrum complanatum]|uniref:Uncharacterized protein n=1 Tax=Diphasiastrum complanatum TaxID=34168 RepID=A0ACC2BZ79_DIPCM|nr:hypothetical protein O6H91_12G017500 [Diphasiastrum complanatum]
MISSSSPPLLSTQNQRQQPHALLCSLPAQGHVAPFLNLARLLASKGIAVTYLSAEHCISPLRGDHSLLTNPLIHLVGLPERVPLREAGSDQFQDTAADQVKHPNYGAADCMIGDACLSWITHVASDLSIPLYTLYTSPTWSLTPLFYVPILTAQGELPLRSSEQRRLMSLPGLPPLWDTDLFHVMRDVIPTGVRRAVLNCSLVLSQSSRILLNTTYEMESDYIDALQKEDPCKMNIKIQAIGPLLPSELLETKDDAQYSLRSKHESSVVKQCIEWLNTQSPASVLYVSFGSLYITSENEIIEIAHGLEASTHAFLWVLRPPPSNNSQNASSWISRVLPQGFQSRTRNRGFIFPHWAPQQLILSNPSIGFFLTHCGWNSILESVCCGVPLIAYPQFGDQNINCRMIVDQLNIGIELEKNEFKGFSERMAVERAVRTVMEREEGHQIRRKVAQLRDRVGMAVKEEYGSSYRNVEAIVQEIYHCFDRKLNKKNTCFPWKSK